ncbi:Pilus assembly, Flp-type CpaB [Moorella glycerini]|uniref:SAF domain protein n=1 Tax=Neomoorella stamsii TaxID=1266720 RepID=A0A9X7J1A4_9FIRM|nr:MULTISPECIES: Flp pilus assembly protein CpaB [Moorella]PRR69670.1 SAF domain protein [Moorella stamsii]CEP67162.1 Pilus assembly, Flp-type CpaB [Moorella glycerini]
MFKNYRLMLTIGLICGGLAAFGAVTAVNQKVGAVPAVVAAKDIEGHQVLAPGDLTVVPVPRAALYKDALPAVSQAVGQVARGYIPAGTVMRASMLLPPAKAGASGLLSDYPGLVALAVKADIETNLAGVLQPGDKVQVMARYKDARGGRYEVLASSAPALVVNDKGVLLGLTPEENGKYQQALAGGAVISFALLPGK